MILAIDIGNTNVVLGMFKGGVLISKKNVPTALAYSILRLKKAFKGIQQGKGVEAVIISSVVPKALRKLKKVCRKTFNCKVFVLGENIKVPIKNKYKKPEQVGQDRLADGAAMYHLHKGGIVVDFGTAVTFDLISRKNEYLGGIIFPGIRLSLENLSHKAALLPKIKLKQEKSLLGKDTQTSMRSGILNGYGALCAGIINKIKKEYGKNLTVLATGGDAPLLAKYCPSIKLIDQNLTLKGLLITYCLTFSNYPLKIKPKCCKIKV